MAPLLKNWQVGHDVTVRRSKVHKVLHCCSNDKQGSPCCGTTWNRDINASKNMLSLTLCMVHGQERPRAFCRQEKHVNKCLKATLPKKKAIPPG